MIDRNLPKGSFSQIAPLVPIKTLFRSIRPKTLILLKTSPYLVAFFIGMTHRNHRNASSEWLIGIKTHRNASSELWPKKIYTILLTIYSQKTPKKLLLKAIFAKNPKNPSFCTFSQNRKFSQNLHILVRKNFFRGAWLGKNPKTPKKPKRHPTLFYAFFRPFDFERSVPGPKIRV